MSIPNPGEIAKAIIDEFYDNCDIEEESLEEAMGELTWDKYGRHEYGQGRVEEMLKSILFLLLEAKAERGGFNEHP